jgi:hypothetical protein
MFFGRSEFLAPEVDGRIYFTGHNVKEGQFFDVYIDEVFGYDYFGRVL